MTPTRPQPPLIDDGFLVEPEPVESDWEHVRRARGCVWAAIAGALAVFWVGVALIVVSLFATPREASIPSVPGAVVAAQRAWVASGSASLGAPQQASATTGRVMDVLSAVGSDAPYPEPSRRPTGGAPNPTSGWATWYDDGPGRYAAVPSWR